MPTYVRAPEPAAPDLEPQAATTSVIAILPPGVMVHQAAVKAAPASDAVIDIPALACPG